MSHPLLESSLRSPYGFGETTAESLHAHATTVRVVDVREPDEFVGELGHVPGSELVPMMELQSSAQGWERDQPIVLVCRSGARSGQMTLALESMGFTHVLNLRGGMIAWNEAGLAVER
ncbi:MAG: rhodanese-like domain-containing protein [Myxococcota bacterium]